MTEPLAGLVSTATMPLRKISAYAIYSNPAHFSSAFVFTCAPMVPVDNGETAGKPNKDCIGKNAV